MTAAACQPSKPSSDPPRVMVIGDSTAASIADQLDVGFVASGWLYGRAVQGGCGILRGQIYQFEGPIWPFACDPNVWNAHAERLTEFHPDVVLSLSVFEMLPRELDGNTACLQPGTGNFFYDPWTPECDAFLLELFDEKRRQFAAYGATWVILTTPPRAGFPGVDRDFGARAVHLNDLVRQFQAAHPDVGILDLASWACPSGPPCPAVVDGVELRPDTLHFGPEGAVWATGRIVPAIISAFS